MIYVGNIARNPDHPARAIYLENDVLELKTIERRVGRPRLNWCSEIMKHVVKTTSFYEATIVNKIRWRKTVIEYCTNNFLYFFNFRIFF